MMPYPLPTEQLTHAQQLLHRHLTQAARAADTGITKSLWLEKFLFLLEANHQAKTNKPSTKPWPQTPQRSERFCLNLFPLASAHQSSLPMSLCRASLPSARPHSAHMVSSAH